MDQVVIRVRQSKKDGKTIFADPKVRGYKDLLIKGGTFYAVYDKRSGFWSKSQNVLSELIDEDIREKYDSLPKDDNSQYSMLLMGSGSNGQWTRYCNFWRYLSDNLDVTLDQKVMFGNAQPKREDYASFKLDYSPAPGDMPRYEKLMSTLYAPAERNKLEWGIGAILDGQDIEKIQKMFVIFGDPGTGKSTILKIIEELVPGYVAYFNSEDLGKGYQFATSAFRTSPLVGIQHDGDLSRMWDNTILNQISAHETIIINEKGVKQYPLRLKTMLFMATNKPVRITDSKAGLLRRLIDISPTGKKIPADEYFEDLDGIKFELGAIADHCIKVYRKLGRSYYDGYVPTNMIARSNDTYNFISDNLDLFNTGNDVSLTDIWSAYKSWVEDTQTTRSMNRIDFMYEIASYFDRMDRPGLNAKAGSTRGVRFHGFKADKFISRVETPEHHKSWLHIDQTESEFDKLAADWPAQYAANNSIGNPRRKWDDVDSTLSQIDTSKLHWVKVPENHIVLDFDLQDEHGVKQLDKNIEAASKFPPTYAELSKSGGGVHLHYIYDGDVSKLKNLYSVHIEVKTFKGNASLRRKLVKCNGLKVAHISSGLPLKGEKSVINEKEIADEKHLRKLIDGCLHKRYMPGTKPNVSFICKLLDEAYDSGMVYDVSDLKHDVITFASNSTHWAAWCLKCVENMKFASEKTPDITFDKNDDVITFYDVEVFPNLFLISYMKDNAENPTSWINPPRKSVLALMKQKLVGFNNRKYDNHMLFAWAELGYTNLDLYNLSHRIISGRKDALFGMAYNLSYADIYDFSAKKQSLKKWEIELGIDHHELGMDWDSPVDPKMWPLVQSYCEDDVRATKAVFHHLHEDFVGREILAKVSGLSVNDTTNTHTTKIIFGDNRKPQGEFNFPDLSKTFPGYTFDEYQPKDKKSKYMGEYPGEGGYVWVYGMENGDTDQDYQDIVPAWERKEQ